MESVKRVLRPILKSAVLAIFRHVPGDVMPRVPFAGLANLIPAGRTFVFTRYLGEMRVLIDHGIFLETQVTHGGYESPIIRKIQRLLWDGARCIDIGANVGRLTLAMANVVGRSGQVLAIEPGPRLCRRMRENIALNPRLRDRITVLSVGLAETEGAMFWVECPDHPGNATLQDRAPERAEHSRVTVAPLDAVVGQQGWSQVDFVKIDVEGMELSVLRGAAGLLKESRPLIVFETLPEFRMLEGRDTFAEIAEMLEGFGYDFAALAPDERFVRCDPTAWCHMTWAFQPEHAVAMGLSA
jgi:FkbM family methyltransferase